MIEARRTSKPRSAGDLYQKVAFDRRIDTNDENDDGTYEGQWQEQFQYRAGFVHLRGGEEVMASRLQGRHVQVIFVRVSTDTRTVSTDWRIRDVRSGIAYNIRDITATVDRKWLDFLCEAGGASG